MRELSEWRDEVGGAVLQRGDAWVKAAPSQAPRAPSHLNQTNSPQPNPSETIPAKFDPSSPASSIPSGSWQLSDARVDDQGESHCDDFLL